MFPQVLYFNSIKVRLELLIHLKIIGLVLYFNSIKVRLEHVMGIDDAILIGFQFHKGTIRTRR